MVIKNNGRKIIGFGQTSVLPGQTVPIEDSFKNNETLKTFIALGFIEVIETKTTDKGNTNKGKGGKSDKGKTDTPAQDDSTQGDNPATDSGDESK